MKVFVYLKERLNIMDKEKHKMKKYTVTFTMDDIFRQLVRKSKFIINVFVSNMMKRQMSKESKYV